MTGVVRSWLLLFAAIAGGLWLIDLVSAGDLVFGPSPLRRFIEWAAIAASGAFAAMLIAQLIFAFAPRAAERERTGLQRVLIYGFTAFFVSFAVLRLYGFDLTSVLAGSALASAVVGLAMQPMLGSMIAGLTLQFDRLLKVGDAVLIDGEPVMVTQLEWRSVIARRRDGVRVAFPNARLAEAPLHVLPADTPVRGAFEFAASSAESPARIAAIARELVLALPLVDPARPVAVSPVSFEADRTQYRATYWTSRYDAQAAIEAQALGRLWYAFQRHRVAFRQGSPPPGPADEDTRAIAAAALGPAGLAETGQLLMFAPGEPLTPPDLTGAWRFLALQGLAQPGSVVAGVQDTADDAGTARLADALAHRIGPYGRYAVARALETSHDLGEARRVAAAEIEDETERATFLADLGPEPPASSPLPAELEGWRDAAGRLALRPSLRAATEVALWACPAGDQA